MQKTTQLPEISVIWTSVTDSTNLDAGRGKNTHPDKTVWAAEFQTAGRGQRGNVWTSQHAENLMFSILLKPTFLLSVKQFLISEAASVAMVSYLSEHGIEARIKWPNDIYVGDRKICGMLIEHSILSDKVSASVVGIGLNVLQRSFPEYVPNPVSMALCMPDTSHIELRKELPKFLSIFYEIYDSLKDESARDALHERYLRLLYRRGEWHRYQEMTSDGKIGKCIVEGRIAGVDNETSRLILELSDGTVRMYAFKEISYII